MWKPAASCLVGGLFPPFDSVYKASTLYLCASIVLMFCVDLLFGQGTLSSCLSGTCNLFFWESGQLVGNTVGTNEPWGMLGSAGGVWPLRHLVCKQCGTIFCFKTGLSGCWLDPFRPRTAGWDECYTKRGSAGCTLCAYLPVPRGMCGICLQLLLWTTAGTVTAPGSWRNRVCFCGCRMCGNFSVQLTDQRSWTPCS